MSAAAVSISNLDKQIAQLYQCKHLSEAEIKVLCEKVKLNRFYMISHIFSLQSITNTKLLCFNNETILSYFFRLKKFSIKNQMFNQLEHLSPFAETSMDNLMIYSNSSRLEENLLKPTIYSQETMLIEVKRSNSLYFKQYLNFRLQLS